MTLSEAARKKMKTAHLETIAKIDAGDRRRRRAGFGRKTGDFFRRLRPSPDTSAATCLGGRSGRRRG